MAKEATKEEERPPYSLPLCKFQPYPWLVISHGKHGQSQTFFSISQHRYDTKIIPEMCNRKILCSSFGWLVLVDNVSLDCLLLNLTSMETIQLPLLNFVPKICILTAPPSDPNCRILCIDNETYDDLIFCSPGDSEFSKQKLEDQVTSMTIFRGKTYCLTNFPECFLFTIEFEGSSPRITKLITTGNESKPFYLEYNRFFLLDFFREMLLVCRYLSMKRFEWAENFGVFKFDFCAREWVEVETIGDNAIFLGDYSCGTCYPAADSIKRNSIYYTLDDEDRHCYVFDLEDQSITTFLPCPVVKSLCSSHYWCMLSIADRT